MRAIAEFELKFKGLKTALILGAGGTAKALAFVLAQSGVSVSVANRSAARLADFSGYKTSLYENLLENFAATAFDIIINTTSAGLKDENLPCDEVLLRGLLSRAKCAFEVIYGKQTPFLSLAKSLKIPCKDGGDMLLWQGVFAFELFFGLCGENLSVNLAKFRDLNAAQNVQFSNSKQNSQNTKREIIFNAMKNALNLP